MPKKILINGKEFLLKHSCRIVVGDEKVAMARHKDMAVFNHGVAVLKLDNGEIKQFRSGKENELSILFYDTGVNEEQTLIFSDERFNKQWKSLFVYLFDEDGVFKLYADRALMNMVGVAYESGSSEYVPEIRQRALNMAELILPGMAKEIMTMEFSDKNEVSLIE